MLPSRLMGVALALLALFSPSAHLAAAAPPSAAGEPLTFRCQPVSYIGSRHVPAVIDLYAENAASLYGLDVQVTFDPAIAEVHDSDAASGVQIEPLSDWFVPGFVARNVACNANGDPGCPTAGTIRYAATQINPQPPVSPDAPNGAFARVTFSPRAEGVFTMVFTTAIASDRDGTIIPSTSRECRMQFMEPTAVVLSSQAAEYAGTAVKVSWQTSSEHDLLGFNIHRSSTAAGPWLKLNGEPLLARSAALPAGNSYSLEDTPLTAGLERWYIVEILSTDGAATRTAPFAARPAGPNAVAVSEFRGAPVSAPLLVGLAPLLTLLFWVPALRR